MAITQPTTPPKHNWTLALPSETHGCLTNRPPTSGAGPTAIFSEDQANVVVVSSFSQFMAASMADASGGGYSYGVQGSVTEFPASEPFFSLSRSHASFFF
jgi:hypothetical protein